MKSLPLVSITVNSYNHEKYVGQAIDSILGQTYQNTEIIIVDDASSDSSPEILQEYKRNYPQKITRLELLQKNIGIRKAANLAVSFANGKYISGFSSDDRMHPDKIMDQVNYLEENNEVSAVFSLAKYIDSNGNYFQLKEQEEMFNTRVQNIRWQLLNGDFLCAQSVLMRADIIKRIKMNNPAIKHVQDFDLWLRILRDQEIAIIQKQLVEYRIHGKNLSLFNNGISPFSARYETALCILDAINNWPIEKLFSLPDQNDSTYSKEKAKAFAVISQHCLNLDMQYFGRPLLATETAYRFSLKGLLIDSDSLECQQVLSQIYEAIGDRERSETTNSISFEKSMGDYQQVTSNKVYHQTDNQLKPIEDVDHSSSPRIIRIHHGGVSTELDHYANLTSNDLNDDMTVGVNSLTSQESIKFNICRDLPLGLSIVFSTRKIDPQFIDHIRNTVGVQDIQIIPYANSGNFSLTELYNRGLQESKYNFVVFIHDDIIFNNGNWGQALLKSFQDTDYGILGIAGTTDLIKDDHGDAEKWWAMDNRMIGRIKHEINGKIVDSVYSNFYDHPIQGVCLDGVFIAVDKNRIRKPFDERFKGFHYYDVSFVFANHLAGVKVGIVFNIDITHKSYGNPNEEWNQNRLLFSSIYENSLPCGIKPEKIEYETSTIRKFNTSHSLVSIIIPTKDKIDLLIDCLQSIIEHTHIARYEIIVADTGSTSENKQKLSQWIKNLNKKPNLNGITLIGYDYYNFAKINNDVVKNYLSKKSSHILFCNNDIKLLNDAVDRCLSLYKEKKNIGTVGIRLHFADHSIQHNGIKLFFGLGIPLAVTHRNIRSYYRYDRETVEVSGNTAAFLMMERPIFTKFYFNESYRECFEDVELNLQMLKLGRKNYQIGHAVAYHYESQTRSEDPDKIKKLMEDYQQNLLPFFKKHCIALFFAPLFEGASSASRNGQFQTAVEICEMLLEHAPQHADIHHLMGVVYGRGGDQARAVKHIRQAIALNGRMPSYHYNLAEALRRQGEWQQAEQSYQQALQLAPNMVDAWVNLALVLEQQGRFNDALTCCQQTLRYDPNYIAAHCGMGDLLRQLGAYDAAVESYQRAIQIQPDWADAYHYLGMVLSNLENRLDEAAQYYRQALQRNPNLIETWINLGKMLEQQGLTMDARNCYQQVLLRETDHALFSLRVESLCPPVLASRMAINSYRDSLWARLEQWRKPEDLRLNFKLLHASGFEPPLPLIYQGCDDRPLKEAWAALFQPLFPKVELPPSHRTRPHVGFVVTRGHEGAFLRGMSGILNQISVDFDLTVVCSQQGSEGLLRASIYNPAIRYLAFSDRIDHSVERLRQAQFTVLYYWEIGTDTINYFMPFFRLAPVQCTGWGWPVTSGIPSINYYLSAQHLETVEGDTHYSERLVRFRRLPVYFLRPQVPAAPEERKRFGLASNQHLYLCVQNIRKVHPDFDELLAGLLRRDPLGIVILIEDIQPAITALLRQRLQTQMPDVIDRVRFLPWLVPQDYLGLLAAADVALDTLHFGGGITTYDALAVGLPIVTLPGAFSRGRYSYAAYRQMGLDEGIAADPEDYIERALRFAQNPDYRATFRQRLREASGELFEDQAAVREFEAFIETAVDEARGLRS